MSSTTETFDLIVIGGGPAGYVAAIRAAQLGMRAVCVEKSKTLGGTCLNIGCIPSKALLDTSEHFYQAKTKFAKHGIQTGDLKIDIEQMMKRKDGVVRQLTGGIAGLFKKHKVEWAHGKGVLAGRDGQNVQIQVLDDKNQVSRQLSAPRVLLATGSVPTEIPSLPIDGRLVITSTEALELKQVPKHLVVVGGGVIGLELGSVWSRLGAKVTVVEYSDHIAGNSDRQAGRELQKLLAKQGLDFKLSAQCLGVKKSGDIALVEVQDRSTQEKFTLEADVVLVSAGRKPFSAGLGLDSVGIVLDAGGRVPVGDHFETSAAGVYAVGDLIRGPMLAHKAEEEGIAAVEIMAGQAGHVNYDAIPNVIYTWPELASVGHSEEELKEKGIPYRAGSFPFLANGRAKGMEETDGFVKILAHAETDRVLGAHIVGPWASDLIAEIVTVIEFGGSAEDIARTCHAHPTLPEVVKEAAMAVSGRQIHI